MLVQHLQHHRRNIVVGCNSFGKRHPAIENKIRRFRCRLKPALCPDLLHFRIAEFYSISISQFMQAVAGEEDAVPGPSCTTCRV